MAESDSLVLVIAGLASPQDIFTPAPNMVSYFGFLYKITVASMIACGPYCLNRKCDAAAIFDLMNGVPSSANWTGSVSMSVMGLGYDRHVSAGVWYVADFPFLKKNMLFLDFQQVYNKWSLQKYDVGFATGGNKE